MPELTLPDGRIPVLLSAHAPELVADGAVDLVRYLDGSDAEIGSVAATLLRTRRVRRHRAVVRAADRGELADGLAAVAAGAEHPLVATSAEPVAPGCAFVFPGQGAASYGIGAEAYRSLETYRAEAERCAAAFDAMGVSSPVPHLRGATGECAPVTHLEVQGAQFVHAVALARVWQSFGVRPGTVVGHSLGEVAAALVAGLITMADAVAVVAARAATMDRLPGSYGVAALGVSPEEAHELIAASAGWLELSVVNSATSVAVSGERVAVDELVTAVRGRGRFATTLAATSPFHTSAFDSVRDDFRARLPRSRFSSPALHFIASAMPDEVGSGTDFGQYWYANLRNAVRFDRATADAVRHGARAFVEMSTHPALLGSLGETVDGLLAEGAAVAVASGRRDTSPTDELSASLAAVAVADPSYRWADYLDPRQPPLPGFPNAPMSAQHIWVAPQPLPPVRRTLTISTETWVQRPLPPPTGARRRIAVLGGAHPLTQSLIDVIDRSRLADLAEPEDADVVVTPAPPLYEPDAERAAQLLGGQVDAGLFDYAESIGPLCRDVWLVTFRGESVAGDATPSPLQAALGAMHRSVGLEHPDQTFRHLDLPSWTVSDAHATAALDVIVSDLTEAAVRVGPSGSLLYVREFGSVPTQATGWPRQAATFDEVVITGGSGVIGMNYAAALAQRGARRIVLLSRRGAEAAALDSLRTRYGVDVVSVTCDITDGDAVAAASVHARDGASLLIHAAGTAGLAGREALSSRQVRDLTAAKLGGLARLVEHWPLRPGVRILVCSSVSGLWGGKGMIAYSAANRLLDVMAGQLRDKGFGCVAVRWGLWENSSLLGADGTDLVLRSGLRPMAPGPAVEASLREHTSDPLVLDADPERLQMFFGRLPAADTGAGGAPVLDAATIAADDPQGVVLHHLGAVLRAEPTALNLDMSLFDMGIDSLLAIDLRKRLKRATGQSVPLARLLGGITGSQLVDAVAAPFAERQKVDASRD